MHFKICRLLLAFSFLFALQACKSDDENILRVPSLHPPKVTGLELVDINGNPIATWGKPQIKTSGKIGDCTFSLQAYPNPFTEGINLSINGMRGNFGQCETKVSIFAVPVEQNPDENGNYFASSVLAKTGAGPALVLLENASLTDFSNFSFNFRGLPAGFYRIYVKIGSEYLWIDTFRATDCSTTPASLRPFVFYICN